jgi:hypothetical protein
MILFITETINSSLLSQMRRLARMIETKAKLTKCQNDIYSVGSVGDQNAANVASIKKSIDAAFGTSRRTFVVCENYLSK